MIEYIIIAAIALLVIKIIFKAAKFVINAAIFFIIIGFILYFLNIDIGQYLSQLF